MQGGQYIDEVILVANGSTYNYYMSDLRYCVTGFIDSTGAVVERARYDGYGKRTLLDTSYTVITTANVNQSYGYTGIRHDNESGLQYYRARYFDNYLGRFINHDPIGYVDGLNLYRGYFIPNLLDPEGLCKKKCGPDITEWLVKTMADNKTFIDTWFNNIPRLLSSGSKFIAFKNLVKTNGPWDYKIPLLNLINKHKDNGCKVDPDCDKAITLCGSCIQYEAISNIAYGYYGKVAGFSESTLYLGAGAAQIARQQGISLESGAFVALFNENYGDEVEDIAGIKAGFDIFNGKSLCDAVNTHKNDFKSVPDSCYKCELKDSPITSTIKTITGTGNLFLGFDDPYKPYKLDK